MITFDDYCAQVAAMTDKPDRTDTDDYLYKLVAALGALAEAYTIHDEARRVSITRRAALCGDVLWRVAQVANCVPNVRFRNTEPFEHNRYNILVTEQLSFALRAAALLLAGNANWLDMQEYGTEIVRRIATVLIKMDFNDLFENTLETSLLELRRKADANGGTLHGL